MTVEAIEPLTLTRGDLLPDAVITIRDSRSDADFTALGVEDCTIIGEVDGAVVFEEQPSTITAEPGGDSAVLRRPWGTGDTDLAGRMYVRVRIVWPNGKPQTFPKGPPLIVDIRRAPGDA